MLAIASALVAAYGLMRLVRTLEPEPLPSPWIHWVLRNRVAMMVIVLLATVLSFFALSHVRRVFAPYDLLLLPIVLLYLLPWRDGAGRSKGLRRIPMLKAPMIAGVWTLATMGLSAAPVQAVGPISLPMIAVLQFSFFLGFAITFDSIDLKHDPPALRTIPQLLGLRSTRYLAAGLMLPWMFALALVQWHSGALDMNFSLPLLGFALAAVLLFRAGPQVPYGYSSTVLDGLLLLIPVLAWCGARF
jgi:hypothetical protein